MVNGYSACPGHPKNPNSSGRAGSFEKSSGRGVGLGGCHGIGIFQHVDIGVV